MTQPDDENDRALDRLGEQLDTFDAKRIRKVKSYGETEGVGEGYRLLAVLISGVIGGLGIGWFFDHMAHTSPIGLIVGLLIGTAAAVYTIARSAMRTSAGAEQSKPNSATSPDDEHKNGG